MSKRLEAAEAYALAGVESGDALTGLLQQAEALTTSGHGRRVTFSKKVFIPLTHLCRDVCHYCTFAQAPRQAKAPFLSPEQVLDIARAGRAMGCKEALFTLGDKPELRYSAARSALDSLGYKTTLEYLAAMADLVFRETGLLPHLNPGVMTKDEMTALRPVSASMGIMLETISDRLSERGGPHWGSPDKQPAQRLETLKAAGELRIPFTTGLLIGIGETRVERIDALLALRDIQDHYGHIQEVIIQNFRAKPETRMKDAPEPSLAEHQWTIAMARLIFGAEMSIQAPPNLQSGQLEALLRAGVDDWGGVSPLTPDHVNPEAPWPHLDDLASETAAADRYLTERLAIGPTYAKDAATWAEKSMATAVLRLSDSEGLARKDTWYAGLGATIPDHYRRLIEHADQAKPSAQVARILDQTSFTEQDLITLFAAEDDDFAAIVHHADRMRAKAVGDTTTYVINRNINYTNICTYRCGFCAFSKGRLSAGLRGTPYDLNMDEVGHRAYEAWQRGATEVCLQGGIHPDYTGNTYLSIVKAVKAAAPELHIHAFSPLEVMHGAETLGLSLHDYLSALKAEGLKSLPGTAAEVLDDEVRRILCPDKITTEEWLSVMRAAHAVGIRTTATIMFGHVDHPRHWARHLLRIKNLQQDTGGFTEFVMLPFVHSEAPIWLKGKARSGPTFREAILMHSLARLVLYPDIINIQASWVKMGRDGMELCLQAGANDMGGTLMDESITRSAGGAFGQEMTVSNFTAAAQSIQRVPRERTMTYGDRVWGLQPAE